MDGQENLHVTSFNGVKVYHCTAGKSEEQWRAEFKGKERLLKKNEDFQSRLTLIHDFSFPNCATHIKVSPDGRYIAASGTYKPRMKLFECENMSLKVERCSDEEITNIQFLADDFSKIACARNDCIIEFHSQAGLHTTVKTPKQIRALSYHKPTCDLFIASSGDEVYRYNLEQGMYQTSILSGFSEEGGGVTALGQNPNIPMLSLCGRGGLESWDLRDRTSIGFLDILNTLNDAQMANKMLSTTSLISAGPSFNRGLNQSAPQASINSLLRSISDSKSPLETTCVRFNDETGMEVSIGLSTGHVLTYDLRSSKPLAIYDHRYDLPIHSIKYHTASRTLITADKKTCRLWDYSTADLTPSQRHLTTIHAPAPMNDLAVVDDTGMIFMACDSPQMHIYFVPRLGTVPDWAAALEALTEELDQQQQVLLQKQYKILATGAVDTTTISNGMNMAMIGAGAGDMSGSVFDNSKFITRGELEAWGMTHLTTQRGVLTPYMHGFLMKMDVYDQLKEMMLMDGKLAPDSLMDETIASDFGHGGAEKGKIQSQLEFIEESIRKEMDKSRDSGFKIDSTLPAVNKNLAALLLAQEAQAATEAAGTKKKSRAALAKEAETEAKIDSILQDERFGPMFREDDYDVDINSAEYRRLNPQLKKSAQLTTEAFRKVADPNKVVQIRAPTLGSGDSLDSNDMATADIMRMEGVDRTMAKLTQQASGLKNYETKGLLGSVGLSDKAHQSLEAKGQLTSKQIKERESQERVAKTKADARVAEQREAQRVASLQKQEKQDKLAAFLTSSGQSASSLDGQKSKQSSLVAGKDGKFANGVAGPQQQGKLVKGSLTLSGVKTGVGMSDLLSGHGTSGSGSGSGKGSSTGAGAGAGNNSVAGIFGGIGGGNGNNATSNIGKRPLSLADRVRQEEQDKAFRERAHIQEQVMRKQLEARQEAEQREKAKENRRSASQNGKKARNVY